MRALRRRPPGAVLSSLAAVVATVLVGGGIGVAAAAPTPAARVGAHLALSSAGGPPQQPVVGSYRYDAACPQGVGVAFAWDSQVVDRQEASSTAQSCSASTEITPPPGDSDPGGHSVIGFLVDANGRPVSRTSAAQQYTVAAADTPPPAPAPTRAPTAAPATPVAVAPAPLATAPPSLAATTPAASTDPGTATGTFAPYGCRNGVPDTTPCPGVAAAPASAVTSASPLPSAAPAATATGVHVPAAAVAGGAGGLLLLLIAATAVGWRSGAQGRRARGVTPRRR